MLNFARSFRSHLSPFAELVQLDFPFGRRHCLGDPSRTKLGILLPHLLPPEESSWSQGILGTAHADESR
jgi:hypothetical protein